MNTKLASETNTDRITSTDRGVSGRQPDGTSASGGSSPTGGGGGVTPLPLLTNAGSPNIQVNKPGASVSYTVYVSIGGSGYTAHSSFPFTILTGGTAVVVSLYAAEPGFTDSPNLTTTYGDLFI